MIRALLLYITEECNFKCKYCCEGDLLEGYMTDDTVKRFIEFAASNIEDKGVVGFFGREPLMRPKIVELIIDTLKIYRPDLYYSLTTNGSLIDKNIDLLRRIDNLQVSFDGFYQYMRSPNIKSVTQNMEILNSENIPFTILTSVHPQMLNRLYDSVLYLSRKN